MRFAYGLANAEGTANIGRMDEGDEFHSGGGSLRNGSDQETVPICFAETIPGPFGRTVGGSGSPTESSNWQNAGRCGVGTAICNSTTGCFAGPHEPMVVGSGKVRQIDFPSDGVQARPAACPLLKTHTYPHTDPSPHRRQNQNPSCHSSDYSTPTRWVNHLR